MALTLDPSTCSSRDTASTSRDLQRTIAPVTSSDLFKTPRCLSKPKAWGVQMPFSLEALGREASSLKASGAALGSDIISLSTGRPHAQFFPFEEMAFAFRRPTGENEKHTNQYMERQHRVGKDDTENGGEAAIDLGIALNYGYSAGSEQMIRFLTEHIESYHDPPYSDWQCCLTVGSTSALDLAIRTLSECGDCILVEQYTYSGMIECAKPLGRTLIPIEMDGYGMSDFALDKVLESWATERPSLRRPRLLYMIPTGQNPTGITQDAARRRALYTVAEEHDLIIIEDDPYYYLQFDDPRDERLDKPTAYLPSYLSMDTAGRVLRLDSTSKLLAPGLRCGWMTGPSSLINRFTCLHDVSIVCPSGVSQLVMYKLLGEEWGHEGFAVWLKYLRTEYHNRMIIMAKACDDFLDGEICSWERPAAGMFFWIRIKWQRHPLGLQGEKSLQETNAASCSPTVLAIEEQVHKQALERGVLCCRGSFFNAGDKHTELFLRLTFVTASEAAIVEAVKRLASALKETFTQ